MGVVFVVKETSIHRHIVVKEDVKFFLVLRCHSTSVPPLLPTCFGLGTLPVMDPGLPPLSSGPHLTPTPSFHRPRDTSGTPGRLVGPVVDLRVVSTSGSPGWVRRT